ncbi:hypothetical protein [Mucilaginibacter jinjuensis]|uniref:Uncharacterized protein n=1 Tax=Mucilaginibacter jinjuensis TaxID=1176721 RepID=A0ABY7T7G4_9SPHI|nr:hypothetical protein [Mucilaginibacter jinjuensis]WCT12229.1 hypothetical protein PQO05_26235 [Mucilaginibacter jinjuensis]
MTKSEVKNSGNSLIQQIQVQIINSGSRQTKTPIYSKAPDGQGTFTNQL